MASASMNIISTHRHCSAEGCCCSKIYQPGVHTAVIPWHTLPVQAMTLVLKVGQLQKVHRPELHCGKSDVNLRLSERD